MADRAFLERLSKELADQGKLIEAGWVGYRIAVVPPDAPAVQLDECRMAFFGGALHLFTSLITIMDPEPQETADDMIKMSLINTELQHFNRQFALKVMKPDGSA